MMKSRLGVFLMVLCFSMVWTFSTMGQENTHVEREKLPFVPTNEKGEKCLDVEQWRQVEKVSNQNKGNYEWRLQIEPTIDMHARVVADYERIIKNLELEIKVLQGDRKYNKARVSELETFTADLQKSRNIAVVGWKITAGVGWVGVLALAITALAVN